MLPLTPPPSAHLRRDSRSTPNFRRLEAPLGSKRKSKEEEAAERQQREERDRGRASHNPPTRAKKGRGAMRPANFSAQKTMPLPERRRYSSRKKALRFPEYFPDSRISRIYPDPRVPTISVPIFDVEIHKRKAQNRTKFSSIQNCLDRSNCFTYCQKKIQVVLRLGVAFVFRGAQCPIHFGHECQMGLAL